MSNTRFIRCLHLAFAISVVVLVVLLYAPQNSYADDIVGSGTCGNNLTWELTESGTDTILTIHGEGPMTNFKDRTSMPWEEGSPWYSERTKITKVVITDGVTTVGKYAFEGCTSLNEVTLPDGIISIGEAAFKKCTVLERITIPSSVERIEMQSFGWCENLDTIELSSELTYVGDSAFRGCGSLEEISLPNNLTTLCPSAFMSCNSIKNITIPGSLTIIDTNTFRDCSGLEQVTIEQGTTTIRAYAFGSCSELSSITIPSSVRTIFDTAFDGCDNIICTVENNSYAHSFVKANKLKYDLTSGHQYDYSLISDASCSKTGLKHAVCKTCGMEEDVVIPPKGHSFGSWIVVTAAKCEESGLRKHVCSICGKTETEVISPEHKWKSTYTIDVPATCLEKGFESIHCSVCDAIKEGTTRSIEKKSHDYGKWIITKAPTCTETGLREKTCVDCGNKVIEEVAEKGHQWNSDYTTDKAATDTEEGSESIRCSVCDEVKDGSTRPIPKLLLITNASISNIDNKTYTGNEITQIPKVTIDDKTLEMGTDYELSYQDNINAGTATIIITGTGVYTGSISETFTIKPKEITPTVVISNAYFTWNNKPQTPTVTVKDGNAKLDKSQYNIAYSKGRKNVGSYSIIVSLKDNYSGTKTTTYTIIPKGTTISSLKSTSNSVTIGWKKQTEKMSGALIAGYQLQYSTTKDFKSGNKTVSIGGYNNNIKKITGLKSGQRYYVKVRTCLKASGKTYYSGWSAIKGIRTKGTTKLNKSSISLFVKNTYVQKLIDPNGKNVKATSVTWKSKSPTIAKIDKYGKITAVKAGTANMTAIYKGKTYKFVVKVTKKTIPKSKITDIVDDYNYYRSYETSVPKLEWRASEARLKLLKEIAHHLDSSNLYYSSIESAVSNYNSVKSYETSVPKLEWRASEASMKLLKIIATLLDTKKKNQSSISNAVSSYDNVKSYETSVPKLEWKANEASMKLLKIIAIETDKDGSSQTSINNAVSLYDSVRSYETSVPKLDWKAMEASMKLLKVIATETDRNESSQTSIRNAVSLYDSVKSYETSVPKLDWRAGEASLKLIAVYAGEL